MALFLLLHRCFTCSAFWQLSGEAGVITITALVVAMVQVLFVKKDLTRSLLEDCPGEFYSLLRMYFEGAHGRKFEF
jgi:hypothetical protein